MLLLPQQDLLLVVSEDGDLVLVAASPDRHTEIAKLLLQGDHGSVDYRNIVITPAKVAR